MLDNDFDTALNKWLGEYNLWKDGKHPYQKFYPDMFDGPPDPEYYHKPFEADPTWYQVYETVTEGTPVTPPFETKEELVNYLVEHGDFWDQKRGDGGWNRSSAENFADKEWAPSGILNKDGYKAPRDM